MAALVTPQILVELVGALLATAEMVAQLPAAALAAP
jgi:hypothetical protein